MAIVALVRTGKLRDSFEERFAEQMDRIRDVEGQLSTLRRDFAVQLQGAAQKETARAPQQPEESKPEPAPAPKPAAPVAAAASHAIPPPVAAFQTPAPAQALEALAKVEAHEPVPSAPTPAPVQSKPPEPAPAIVAPTESPTSIRPVLPAPIAPSFTFAASQPPRPEENRPPRMSARPDARRN